MTSGRRDLLIAIGLALSTTLVVGLTADSVGFTRDEGYYFKAGEQYWGWFRAMADKGVVEALSQKVIDKHLSYNPEHPVLLKMSFALSYGIGHEVFGIFDTTSAAFRFPAWCFAGLSVFFLFLLARAFLPLRGALLAVLMWVSMPRVFWHMHLACFDIAVCAAHVWLVFAYWRGRRSLKGALVAGIAFGLAAATKHNVLVTPAFLVAHWIIADVILGRRAATFGATIRGLRFPAVPMAFLSMAIVGPIVFVMHWPYLWPSIVKRVGSYIAFHLSHEHYPILYFGELLDRPPFPVAFPFVMSAVTVPLPVVVAMILGVVLAFIVVVRHAMGKDPCTRVPLSDDEPSHSGAVLLLLNLAFPFLLIALPSSPIFGGTKHWMNALPFLCILGAWAIYEGCARIVRGRVVFWVVLSLVVAPGVWTSVRVHPFGLGSYNALVGFARGAATVGFQRTFWGYEPRPVLDDINRRAKKGAKLHFGDTNYDDYRFYRRDGMLRKDILWAGNVRGSDVASVQPQGEFKVQWMKVLDQYGRGPDVVVHIEGVPLSTLTYKKEPTP